MGKKLDLKEHDLVPPHKKLTKKEAKKVIEKYNIDPSQLPKILSDDLIVKKMNAKPGDIIKIRRKSRTGKYNYYRLVAKHG